MIQKSEGKAPGNHHTTPQTMTRLELLHTIQDNADALTLPDAVSLLAGRLPQGDAEVTAAWEHLTLCLMANAAIGY